MYHTYLDNKFELALNSHCAHAHIARPQSKLYKSLIFLASEKTVPSFRENHEAKILEYHDMSSR